MCADKRVYRDTENISVFALHIEGKDYHITNKSLNFERNFLQICQMIKNDYSLKCCFTCQYSDYSPYGSDDYGTMLCYRKHKTEYLKVNDKDDYFKYLEGLDCDTRQETYLCKEYETRKHCSGYRGFVE